MAKTVDPYELLDNVTTRDEALKALRKAAKAENSGDAIEILVPAWSTRFFITEEDVQEALKA